MARGAKPGERRGGRKRGTPNKVTADVRELCQGLLSKDYRARLEDRLLRGKAHPTVESMVWYYAFGKPKDTVKVEGELIPPLRIVKQDEPSG